MKILAIDSTRENLVVLLAVDGTVFSKVGSDDKRGHSPNIILFIDEVLRNANVALSDIDAIAAVVGPGSFTGIRIGVSTANALAFALGLKRIEVDSFELLSQNQKDDFVCVVDALHQNCYFESYQNEQRVHSGYCDRAELKNKRIVEQQKGVFLVDELGKVVSKKYNLGQFSDMIKPLYLRKSQAERLADEKGNEISAPKV